MLNTDYKILAKALISRLNKVITKLIASNQCGFRKGRNIATILRTTKDVNSYLDVKQLSELLVAIEHLTLIQKNSY